MTVDITLLAWPAECIDSRPASESGLITLDYTEGGCWPDTSP